MCITTGDADSLVRIPGVGRKTERLLIKCVIRMVWRAQTCHWLKSMVRAAVRRAKPSARWWRWVTSRPKLSIAQDHRSGVSSVEEIIRHALKAAVQK
jgi:hypothetical protein